LPFLKFSRPRVDIFLATQSGGTTAMNLLVYDDQNVIAHLVRAALCGRHHRVSLSADPAEAQLKLDTGLFDAIIIGPGGAPQELADHVEQEWPALPIILAGMPGEAPVVDPIIAVLKAPLSLADLNEAVRKLENKEAADRRKMFDMPVDVIAGEKRLACRVVIAGKDTLFLERRLVEGDTFSDTLPPEPYVTVSRGTAAVRGSVAFVDRAAGGVKYLGVRLDPEATAHLLEAAETGPVAPELPVSFPLGADMEQHDPLELES
jgi:hypothetical protein